MLNFTLKFQGVAKKTVKKTSLDDYFFAMSHAGDDRVTARTSIRE